MTIGENIKKIRKEKKITQQQLAKQIGISRSYLGDLENNRYSPSARTLDMLANKLDVTMLYLTTGNKALKDLNEAEQKELSKEILEKEKEKFKSQDEGLSKILLELSKSKFTFVENHLLSNTIWFLQEAEEKDMATLLVLINRLNTNKDKYIGSSDEEMLKHIDEETTFYRDFLKSYYGYEG